MVQMVAQLVEAHLNLGRTCLRMVLASSLGTDVRITHRKTNVERPVARSETLTFEAFSSLSVRPLPPTRLLRNLSNGTEPGGPAASNKSL